MKCFTVLTAKESLFRETLLIFTFFLIFSHTLAVDIRIAKRPRVSSGSEADRQTATIRLNTRSAAKRSVQPSFKKDGVNKIADTCRNSGRVPVFVIR